MATARLSSVPLHDLHPPQLRGLSLVSAFHHSGKPEPLALTDWLEELAVFGKARSPRDTEIANQLSLAVENWYLVRSGLNRGSV